ncbi:MAG: hypothetical protein F4213_13020 [Boseongicola sp. SB0677_bin_26]|nr:hypothetical protein [Gemmatimonadota bacterium]MYG26922.1 hypothetical protein [Boseongicola sp. SB0677_bin_26]
MAVIARQTPKQEGYTMMNLIGQRTTPDGLARLARPWQATLALALALLPAAGTAAAQDTTPPPLKSARIDGTTLTLAFDKPVVIGTTSLLVQGFTVDGISNSGSLHPSAMSMDNRTATLELDVGAEPGQTVTVSYDPDNVPNTPPTPGYPNGRHMPLEYIDGTLVPGFSGAPVTILAPKPATDLTFSNQVGTTIDLSWTLPTRPEGVVVTSVEVHSAMTHPGSGRTPNFSSYGLARLAAGTTSITWPIIHGGFTHAFRVRLVTDNYHADSEVASWTSTQAGLKPPTGLTASNATQTTVDLAWTLPEQAAWVTQAGDEIWSRVQSQAADGTWSTVATLAADAVAHTVTGLSAGTAYSFRVGLAASAVHAPSKPVSVTTLDEKAPLTAAFHDVPARHGGRRSDFSFELRFSENFPGKLPYKKLRDEALSATHGKVTGARRAAPNQNQRWIITVRPLSSEDVTVTLAATTVCSSAAAICTPDGRMLSNSPSVTIKGPSAPGVTGIVVSSDAGADSTYGKGDTIRVMLTFSQAVEVTGTPRLKIDMDPAHWGEKWAMYGMGSGTESLTFAHEVVEPNFSGRGIAVLTNSLQLNGGTIRSKATGADADLAHAGLAHDPNHRVDWRQSASAGDVANGDVVEDPSALVDEALAMADGLTPDDATRALFGEATLSEVQRTALDRLGNRNGSYDLGDLLSWIERCRRGAARCGRTSADAGPVGAAALLAAVGRRTSGRGGRRAAGPRGDATMRRGCRRGRASYAVGVLLAAIMTWSCADGSAGPVAPYPAEPDPGFLAVELAAPDGNRDRGVLLELEGPGIEAVQAPGLQLYQSEASGPRQLIVAGSLREGPIVRFEVPDRGQLPLYRVRVIEVTGEDYGLRDTGEYRAVITR